MSAQSMAPATFGNINMLMAAVAAMQGEIAVVDDDGYVTPATVATGLRAIGIFGESKDNSDGTDGSEDISVMTSSGVFGGVRAFPLGNHSGDLVDQSCVGKDVYIASVNTVAKTDGGGTRSRAGRCWGFTRRGEVLVEIDRDTDATDVALVEARLDDIEGSAPAMQAVDATLTAGTITISSGIVVASNSEVIPLLIGAITGSSNFASLRELKTSRVNGFGGVGTVVIEAVGADGAKDADAAGAIRVVILTPLS